MRCTGLPSISSSSAPTAAAAIACTGWRTVVSGGSVNAISGESSKPTTETSPGTSQPALAGGPDHAERHHVAAADDAGAAASSSSAGRGRLAALDAEQGARDELFGRRSV